MKEALQNIRQSADALIAQAADAAAVDELRVRFLGGTAHRFKQVEGADDIGLDEFTRAVNRTVDV